MTFEEAVELVGKTIDAVGVAVIAGGIVVATVVLLGQARRDASPDGLFRRYRQSIGRAILLGLEFLVAADIIRTVAVEPTLRSVAVLGVIVVIRTFLSVALEVELEGRWPWERERRPT